jgi:hypothetical protein
MEYIRNPGVRNSVYTDVVQNNEKEPHDNYGICELNAS